MHDVILHYRNGRNGKRFWLSFKRNGRMAATCQDVGSAELIAIVNGWRIVGSDLWKWVKVAA